MVIIDDTKRKRSVFLQDDPYLAHVVPENGTTQSVSEHLSGVKNFLSIWTRFEKTVSQHKDV